MIRRTFIAVAAFSIALLGLGSTARSGNEPQAPRRVIVKVRSTLAGNIEAALPMSAMTLLPGQSGNAAVEAFFRRHTARKMAPLYPGIVRQKKATGETDFEISSAIRQRFAKRARRLRATFVPPEISRTYVLELDATNPLRLGQILMQLRADPDIEFAEEDHVVHTNVGPNDPYLSSTGSWGQLYDDLWGIKKVGAPTAWNTSTGAGVIVAVVDTGIDYNHPDIAANIWTNTKEIAGNGIDDDHNGYIDDIRGWDFVGPNASSPIETNDPIDHNGHGTHVAGTIAAVGNNGIGVIGVAWHAQVMAVKGLDDAGDGVDSTLGPAIIYAANNGADVINASWGGLGSSQAVAEAVNYAYNLGAIFVSAAGNNGVDALNFYPANLWNAIAVAASDPNDNLASFSNFGSKIDVAAPGVDILSLQASGTSLGPVVSPGYIRLSGTSMAAPHVSGIAALILSEHPEYTNEQVRQAIRVSATDVGATGFDNIYGYGRANAPSALGVSSPVEAKIDSPTGGTIVQGVFTVAGVARGAAFSHYILEYGAGAAPTTWTPVQTGASPVNGTLGQIDSLTLANGIDSIRLTAYNTSGQAFVDRIDVSVSNAFILSPSVPPTPTSPATFKNGVAIPVTGTATGAGFSSFQVEWAPGLDAGAGWQTTGMTLTGGGLSPVTSATLATWDTSSITMAGYFTIRLTVNASASTSHLITIVYLEPTLLSSNWPEFLEQGPQGGAGVVPALNADGSLRLLVEGFAGPSSLNGAFWTLPMNGPAQGTPHQGHGSSIQPSVADFSGAPGEEAVAMDFSSPDGINVQTSLELFHQDRSLSILTTVPNIWYFESQTVVEDLSGDSHWTTLGYGNDWNNNLAYISAWRPDGTQAGTRFPISMSFLNPVDGRLNRNAILVGDVDGDGQKEIVALQDLSPTTFTLNLYANDATPKAWKVPVMSEALSVMAAADLDNNGKLETIVAANSDATTTLHVFQPDGTERTGWPLTLPNSSLYSQSYLAVADLNRDGHKEIIYSHEAFLYVLKPDGTSFSSSWPLSVSAGQSFGYNAVVVGDVDGDGFPEIVTVLSTLLGSSDPFFQVGGGYADQKLLAIRRDGTISESWQINAGYGCWLEFLPTPAIGDFNQDGKADIAVAQNMSCPGFQNIPGVVTIVTTGAKFNAALNDWPLVRHDERNTSVLQNVNAYTSSSTTTLTASADPSVSGQQLTLTATVARQTYSLGTNTPTGKVTFLDGATNLGSCTLAAGVCTFSTSALSSGTHMLSGMYAGDAHFTVSTSPSLSEVITGATPAAGSTTTLASSINPSLVGAPVAFTVTVTPQAGPGADTPTGQATISDGGASLGTCTLASGSCTFATSALSLGTHAIVGKYAGDTHFLASTSSSLSQVVALAGSTTTVTSLLNPSLIGRQVSFTAAVAPHGGAVAGSTPTGQVLFSDAGTNLGSCTLASGACTFMTSSLATGTHSIAALYVGDTFFSGSTSLGLSQVVNRVMSSISVSTSANPSIAGQAVTFSATVSGVAPGNLLPTGTVTLYDSNVSIGTAALDATGVVKFTVTDFATGTHSVTATYGGDGNFLPGVTSAPLLQAVSNADFSLATSSAQTVSAGASASYSISVSPGPAGFTHTVTNFACTGLPTGAACTFNPMSVTPGSTGATTTLTIGTTSRTLASAIYLRDSRPRFIALWTAAGMLGFLGVVIALSSNQRRRTFCMCSVTFLVLASIACGCGGGSAQTPALPSPPPTSTPNRNGTPAGTYAITVTATGNGINHTATVTLIVN